MTLKRGLRWATPSLWSGAERIEREFRQERVLGDLDEKTDVIVETGGSQRPWRPLPSAPFDSQTMPTGGPQGLTKFQTVPPHVRDPVVYGNATSRQIAEFRRAARQADIINRRLITARLNRVGHREGGFNPTQDFVYQTAEEAEQGDREEEQGAHGGHDTPVPPPAAILDLSMALAGSSTGYFTPRSSSSEGLQSGGTPTFLEFVSE